MKRTNEINIINARILLASNECELAIECTDNSYYYSIWNLEDFTEFVKAKNKNKVGVKVYFIG